MPLEAGARLWDLPAFPLDEIEVDLAYRSDILRSRQGREQRRALRNDPRRTITQRHRVVKDGMRAAMELLRGYQPLPWAWPDRTRAVKTTTDLLLGGNVINVAATPNWAVAGEGAAMKKAGLIRLFTIQSTTATSITFVETAAEVFLAGSEVLPALPARLRSTQPTERPEPDLMNLSAVLDIQPALAYEPSPPAAPATFNGRELFTRPPHISERPDNDFLAVLETLDFGYGAVAHKTPEPYNSERLALRYLSPVGGDLSDIENLFRRAKGRRGEIHMPTFARDLIPTTAALSGSSAITVAGDLLPVYGGSTVYTAVAVQRQDAAWEVKQVSSLVSAVPNTIINILGTWGADVDPATIRRMSWCPAWRFGSDALKVIYQGEHSRATVTLQTIEDLP